MPAVLDTHACIWWLTEDRRLSARARKAADRAAARGDLFVSMMSLWEIAKLVEHGKLSFNQPLDSWLDTALATGRIQVAELTQRILLDSCRLPQPFHGDPADQIIVSTTRSLSATLITRDARLLDYSHVRSVW